MTTRPLVDIGASLDRLGDQLLMAADRAKLPEDLERYRAVIAAGAPDVVVECGTWRGGSARWFADEGLRVVTIDTDHLVATGHPMITQINGNSVSPDVIASVRRLVRGQRVMVSLDSDHSARHVAAEIGSYGQMVSVGCHLVVEDGIVRWSPEDHWSYPGDRGSPLDAVEEMLAGRPEWRREEEIEAMFPVSMNPAGWWRRCA